MYERIVTFRSFYKHIYTIITPSLVSFLGFVQFPGTLINVCAEMMTSEQFHCFPPCPTSGSPRISSKSPYKA